jgi:hypothetical protein
VASRRTTFAIGAGLSLLFAGFPVVAHAHGGAPHTAEDHIEEDSVAHTPAVERRLERSTLAATAADAEAVAAAVADDPGQVGEWGQVLDWPVASTRQFSRTARCSPTTR